MRDSRGRCVGVLCEIDEGDLLCEIDERGGLLLCERKEGGGCVCAVREACDFGKWFTKNLGVNHFPKFCTTFSGQQKLFAVDQHFTTKQTPANTENILWKTFYSETNGA